MINHSSSEKANNLHQASFNRFSHVHNQEQCETSDLSCKSNDRKGLENANSSGTNFSVETAAGSDAAKNIVSASAGNYRRYLFGQRAGSPIIGTQSKLKMSSAGSTGISDVCDDSVNPSHPHADDKNTGSSKPSYKRFRKEPDKRPFSSCGKNAHGPLDNGRIDNDDVDESDFDDIDDASVGVSGGLNQYNRLPGSGIRQVHGDVGEASPGDERSALISRPRRDHPGFSDFDVAAASDAETMFRGRQSRQAYRPQAHRRRDLSLTNTGGMVGQPYPVSTASRSFYIPTAGGGTLPRRQPGLTRATTIGGADYPLQGAGSLHSPIPLLHRPMRSATTAGVGMIPPPPSEPPPATPLSGSLMSDAGAVPNLNLSPAPLFSASAVGPLYPQQGFIATAPGGGMLLGQHQQHAVWASAPNPANAAYLFNPNLTDASQLLQLQLFQQQQQQQQLAVNSLMLESQLSQQGQHMLAATGGAYVSNYGTLGRQPTAAAPVGVGHLDDTSSVYLSAAALLSAQQQQQYLAGSAVGPPAGFFLTSSSQADQLDSAAITNNNVTSSGMQLCRSPGGMVYENSYNSFRRLIPQPGNSDGFHPGLMTNSASGLTESLIAQHQQQQTPGQDAQLLHAAAVLNAAAVAAAASNNSRIVEPTYVAHPMPLRANQSLPVDSSKVGMDVANSNATAVAVATIERKSTRRNGLRCPWYAWIIAVLFTAFLLAMVVAVVFSAEKRRLDRRLQERFAQDPAIIGLFDPDNPPAQIAPDKPIDLFLPPLGVWTGQWRMSETRHVRYNLTLSSALASIGVFLRQNTMPTIVRYDIFDQISGRGLQSAGTDSLALNPGQRRTRAKRSVGAEAFRRRWARNYAPKPSSGYETSGSRQTSRLHYLEDGIWFIALVNDQPRQEPITFSMGNAVMEAGCPNGCSNRGVCSQGNCDCVNGFKGPDCSIAELPKICNGHGDYIAGQCHCYAEWKGPECSILWSECVDSVCSGRGQCVTGTCHCYQGYEGETCAVRTCPAVNCSNNGICADGQCRCFSGFSGPACDFPVPVMQTSGLLGASSRTGDAARRSELVRPPNDLVLRDTGDEGDTLIDCPLDCGSQGHCHLDPGTDLPQCKCLPGWAGDRCSERLCDPRCSRHGHCENGTCVCRVGWNGKHCTLDGCPARCSGVGQCLASTGRSDHRQVYACHCPIDRKGTACQTGVELDCADGLDNDADNLADCLDPDCCASPHCRTLQTSSGEAAEDARQSCAHSDSFDRHILITPVAPPGSTFYGQLEFLLHRKQIVANNFDPRRISVIRGTIRQWDGTPLWGCRIADRRNMRSGYTLTDTLGRFDLPVEGGGMVDLELLRFPTNRFSASFSLYVPVNEIVILGDFYMQDAEHPASVPAVVSQLTGSWNRSVATSTGGLRAPSPIGHDLWTSTNDGDPPAALYPTDCSTVHDIVALGDPLVLGDIDRERKTVCLDRDRELCVTDGVLVYQLPLRDTRVHLVYRSNRAVGHRPALVIHILPDNRAPPSQLTEIHLVIDVAGLRHVRRLEPELGLTELYYWNRTDGYNRTVYGLATAQVSIGYVYAQCGAHQVYWERRVAQLEGEELSSAELANWNLDLVHFYAVNHDIVYRGDGDHMYLRRTDWHVTSILGTPGATPRWLQAGGDTTCTACSSPNLPGHMSPVGQVHTLVSDSKGCLLVGDGAFVRVLQSSSGDQSEAVQRSLQKSYTNSELLNSRAQRVMASDDRTIWLAKTHILLKGLQRAFNLNGAANQPAYWMAVHPAFAVRTLDKVTGQAGEETGVLLSHTFSQTIWWLSATPAVSGGDESMTLGLRPLISHSCQAAVKLLGGEALEQTRKSCFGRPLDEPRGIAVSATEIYFTDSALILQVPVGIIETRSLGYSSKVVIGRMDIPLPPPACDRSMRGSQMRLQAPTDLVYSPMEDALYFVDGKQVFRFHIVSQMVSLAAGRLPHCPVKVDELGSRVPLAREFEFSEIRGIAVSPQGELYIAEPDRIWIRKADARLHAVAGQSVTSLFSGQQRQNYYNGSSGQPTGSPHLGLARDFRFHDITAISVSIYGELFVADANLSTVLRIHYQSARLGTDSGDLQPDGDGGTRDTATAGEPSSFRVVSKATDETFLFNRHGQLAATETADTGLGLHRMEYRANANLGWLTQIQGDSRGLRLRLHRDTQGKLLRFQLPTGLLYNVSLETTGSSGLPQIGQLTDPITGGRWRFGYSPATRLLTQLSRPGDPPGAHVGLRYDPVSGRLVSLVRVDGGLVEIKGGEAVPPSRRGGELSVSLMSARQSDSSCRLLQSTDSTSLQTAFGGPDNRWTIDIGRRHRLDSGIGRRQLQLFRHVQVPERQGQPMLEHTSLWTVDLKTEVSDSGRSHLRPDEVDSHYPGAGVGGLAAPPSDWGYQKTLSVNGQELLRVSFDWARQLETYYCHPQQQRQQQEQQQREPSQILLQIVYNANLQPMIFNASLVDLDQVGLSGAHSPSGRFSGDVSRLLPASAPAPLSLTYTGNGQLDMFHWGSAIYRFTYDPVNRLTAADLGSPAHRITYQYTDARIPQQPSVITVSGSGQYNLVYSDQALRLGSSPVSTTTPGGGPSPPGLWRVVSPTGLHHEFHRLLGIGVQQLIFSPWPGTTWTYEWSEVGGQPWFQFAWPRGRVAVRLQRGTRTGGSGEPNRLVHDETLVEWWQTAFTCPDSLYAHRLGWATDQRLSDASTGFHASLSRKYQGSLVTGVAQSFRVPSARNAHPWLGGLLNAQLGYAYNSLLRVSSIRTQLFTQPSDLSANHLLLLDETTLVKYDPTTGRVLGQGDFDVTHRASSVCLAYQPKQLQLCRQWDGQGRVQQVVLFSLAGHRDPVFNLSVSYPATGLAPTRQREEQRGQVPRWVNLDHRGPGGRLQRLERQEAGSSLRSHSELVFNPNGRVALLRVAMSDPQSPHLVAPPPGDFSSSSIRSEERQFVYDRRGFLLHRGNWDYRFDSDGLLVERRLGPTVRDLFAHNSKGLLTWAERVLRDTTKGTPTSDSLDDFHHSPIDDHVGVMSPFRVQFLYDSQDRLVVVRDLLAVRDLVQYFYTDPEHPGRITHLFDHGRLATLKLSYDPVRGHIFALEEFHTDGKPGDTGPATMAPEGYGNATGGQQMQKRVYFVITNHEGSPTAMFSEDGNTVWTAEYSITGSRRLRLPNRSQLFATSMFGEALGLPLGLSGCPMDVHTGLVFCSPTGRAFDPLGDTFTSPDWQTLLSHRLPALHRDPSLLDTHQWENPSREEAIRRPGWWLEQVGFHVDRLLLAGRVDMCSGNLGSTSEWGAFWDPPRGVSEIASPCGTATDERRRWNTKVEQLSTVPSSRLTPGNQETGSGLPWLLDQGAADRLLLLPAQTMFGSSVHVVLDARGYTSIVPPPADSPSPAEFRLASYLLSGARLLDWWTETVDLQLHQLSERRLHRTPRLVQLFLRLPCSFDSLVSEMSSVTGGHHQLLPLLNITSVSGRAPPELWLTSLRSDIQWRIRCAPSASQQQLLPQVTREAERRGQSAAWRHEHQLISKLMDRRSSDGTQRYTAAQLARLSGSTARYLLGLRHVWTLDEVDQLSNGEFAQLEEKYQWRRSIAVEHGNTSGAWVATLAAARFYDNPRLYAIRPKALGDKSHSGG